MKKVFISYPVDWISGFLRYGHKEGNVEMTDEEFEQFKNDPVAFLKSNECYLELLVDDFRIADYSDDIYNVEWSVNE